MASDLNGGDGGPAMFNRIATRYDLVNRINSLGMDVGWRRRLVSALGEAPAASLLDVATGPGTVAIEAALAWPEAQIVAVDLSGAMLERARRKLQTAGLKRRVRLMFADAHTLPFSCGAFDASCIAFGIRDMSAHERVLEEMARVTRPGGRVAVLELAEPQSGILGTLARFHVHHVVPRVGALLGGAAREYRQLQRSIRAFPRPAELSATMEAVGIEDVRIEQLSFAAAYLLVGVVG